MTKPAPIDDFTPTPKPAYQLKLYGKTFSFPGTMPAYWDIELPRVKADVGSREDTNGWFRTSFLQNLMIVPPCQVALVEAETELADARMSGADDETVQLATKKATEAREAARAEKAAGVAGPVEFQLMLRDMATPVSFDMIDRMLEKVVQEVTGVPFTLRSRSPDGPVIIDTNSVDGGDSPATTDA